MESKSLIAFSFAKRSHVVSIYPTWKSINCLVIKKIRFRNQIFQKKKCSNTNTLLLTCNSVLDVIGCRGPMVLPTSTVISVLNSRYWRSNIFTLKCACSDGIARMMLGNHLEVCANSALLRLKGRSIHAIRITCKQIIARTSIGSNGTMALFQGKNNLKR